MERAIKSLVLIRAKHLAESVTTPTFVADADGNLIFFNEGAEVLLGRAFSDTGAMPADEWARIFNIRSRDDSPFPLEAMPGWMQVQQHKPALGHLKFTSADGSDHFIAVCAVPLFTSQEQFEGALVVFWQDDD